MYSCGFKKYVQISDSRCDSYRTSQTVRSPGAAQRAAAVVCCRVLAARPRAVVLARYRPSYDLDTLESTYECQVIKSI